MATYPELIDRAAFVTGAGRGIGLMIARRFVTEGTTPTLIIPGR